MSRKTSRLSTLICLILLGGIELYNRYQFGTWFPLEDPKRIEFQGRRYYLSGIGQVISGKKLLLIKRGYYWGRGLYVDNKDYQRIRIEHKYKMYMSVYLKGYRSGFSVYVISGGP